MILQACTVGTLHFSWFPLGQNQDFITRSMARPYQITSNFIDFSPRLSFSSSLLVARDVVSSTSGV